MWNVVVGDYVDAAGVDLALDVGRCCAKGEEGEEGFGAGRGGGEEYGTGGERVA